MSSSLKTLVSSLILIAAGAVSAHAEVGGGRIVVEYAEKAIAKGYGGMCSLAMVPVASGGYYHCIDFGPYRYVKGYEGVSAYVVQKGQPPYQVMGGAPDNPVFVIKGPWESDLPMRVISYWNEVVEGGAERLKRAEETTGRKKAAEEYINSLVKKEKPAVVVVEGERKTDKVVDQVLNDEIGKPVAPADLKQALQEVGR